MLRDQKGIHSIKVALLAERAVVDYDPSLWTAEKLVEASPKMPHFSYQTSAEWPADAVSSTRKYPT